MKTRTMIFLVAVILMFSAAAFAAVPRTINYQGYLTDENGMPVNGQADITFTLYKADDSQVYTETINTVDVVKGVYSVVLGVGASMSLVPFDEQYFLGVAVNGGVELTPRMPLTSTAYSIRSAVSDSAATGAVTADSIAPGAVTPAKLASVCSEGDFLVKTSGGWACSSTVANFATTKRPWGCAPDRASFDSAICLGECEADAISSQTCSDFCNSSALFALISGGDATKYCGR